MTKTSLLLRGRMTRRRMNLLTVGSAIAASLLVSISTMHAVPVGALESRALAAALSAAGTNVNDATAQQLANAVTSVLGGNARFRPGVVAGEALKLPASLVRDAGDEIATAALTARTNPNRALIAGEAGRQAGSGRNANVGQVPAFAALVLTTQTEALAAANISRGSRAGAGALIGGFARTLANDAAKTSLTNTAVSTATLLAAAGEIARFVALEINGDTAAFARTIAEANDVDQPRRPRNIPLRIAPGVVAADPENAGNITNALISSNELPILKRQAAALATVVSRVADIEQIVPIGKHIADQIGLNTGIRLSQATVIARTLAASIVLKPSITGVVKSNPINKEDELGELAAAIVSGIVRSAEFDRAVTLRRAGATIFAVINSINSLGALKRRGRIVATRFGLPNFLFADVAGSVALTIENSGLSRDVKNSIRDFLLAPRIVALLGGDFGVGAATGGPTTGVRAAISAGFSGTDDVRFENGFNPGSGLITDPETDSRNI